MHVMIKTESQKKKMLLWTPRQNAAPAGEVGRDENAGALVPLHRLQPLSPKASRRPLSPKASRPALGELTNTPPRRPHPASASAYSPLHKAPTVVRDLWQPALREKNSPAKETNAPVLSGSLCIPKGLLQDAGQPRVQKENRSFRIENLLEARVDNASNQALDLSSKRQDKVQDPSPLKRPAVPTGLPGHPPSKASRLSSTENGPTEKTYNHHRIVAPFHVHTSLPSSGHTPAAGRQTSYAFHHGSHIPTRVPGPGAVPPQVGLLHYSAANLRLSSPNYTSPQHYATPQGPQRYTRAECIPQTVVSTSPYCYPTSRGSVPTISAHPTPPAVPRFSPHTLPTSSHQQVTSHESLARVACMPIFVQSPDTMMAHMSSSTRMAGPPGGGWQLTGRGAAPERMDSRGKGPIKREADHTTTTTVTAFAAPFRWSVPAVSATSYDPVHAHCSLSSGPPSRHQQATWPGHSPSPEHVQHVSVSPAAPVSSPPRSDERQQQQTGGEAAVHEAGKEKKSETVDRSRTPDEAYKRMLLVHNYANKRLETKGKKALRITLETRDLLQSCREQGERIRLVNEGYSFKHPFWTDPAEFVTMEVVRGKDGKEKKEFYYNGELISCSNRRAANRYARRQVKCIVCIYCESKFADATDVTRHTRTHTDVKPFKCKVAGCFYRHRQLVTVEQHQDKVHGIPLPKKNSGRPKTYACEFTGKLFSNGLAFMNHDRNCELPHLDMQLRCKDKRIVKLVQESTSDSNT